MKDNNKKNLNSGSSFESSARSAKRHIKDVVSQILPTTNPSISLKSSSLIGTQDKDLKQLDPPFPENSDLICLSHLRWDFVYQRPQHLLSRCAKERRVFFFEEPIFGQTNVARLEVSPRDEGLWVVVPHLPEGMNEDEINSAQRQLLDDLLLTYNINSYIFWYYTPMALPFTRHLDPQAIIYDCMDELSAFKGAPPALIKREKELFERADLVFTGGQSLYEAKCTQHQSVYAFPSSIDVKHFAQARNITSDPVDQVDIPHPRLGFFGVVDERMNLELIDEVAASRPDWHLVIIGPVVKIDPAHLPKRPNIHYLGGKNYKELPSYIAGWDVAIMPFAKNESTKFISPTKTPEYLAAGKPVVSTSIRDVVRPYGQEGLVQIEDTAEGFVKAAEVLMSGKITGEKWLKRVDAFLSQTSWDRTWNRMSQLIQNILDARRSSTVETTVIKSTTQPVRTAVATAGGNLVSGD
jgi:glycosyltransferase involved in cell wall biosynthesis